MKMYAVCSCGARVEVNYEKLSQFQFTWEERVLAAEFVTRWRALHRGCIPGIRRAAGDLDDQTGCC